MKNFNTLMSEALDDTLKQVLGETLSELIYSNSKRQPALNQQETKSTIAYLEKLLGKEGTRIIQTMSIKRLCLKLEQEYEEIEAHYTFLDKLYETKFKLLSSLLNGKYKTYN